MTRQATPTDTWDAPVIDVDIVSLSLGGSLQVPVVIDVLTVPEADRKAQLVATIEKGLNTFVEVGLALIEIRDSKLYRDECTTFEEFCRNRFTLKRTRAYEIMGAAAVAGYLSEISDIVPARESHAAPLAPLSPDLQREAWREAVDTAPNGKVTAAHVQAVVDRITQPERPNSMEIHYSSDSPEWYTPPVIIERTERVLGAIDLDPCSNVGTANVPAARHYTWADDGLSQFWQGRVYMNPPYGREIGDWVDKLREAYETGSVIEAIALLPARTDTAWFHSLRVYPRCFVSGRLKFSEHGSAAPFPSMAVYLGKNLDRFVAEFGDIGDVFQIVEGR